MNMRHQFVRNIITCTACGYCSKHSDEVLHEHNPKCDLHVSGGCRNAQRSEILKALSRLACLQRKAGEIQALSECHKRRSNRVTKHSCRFK